MTETSALTPDLLLRHEAFVLRLARSLVRDDASAQDVTQETLLAALRHAPPAASLRGWLARVVRHRASDHRRGERRRAEREAIGARPESQPPMSSAAERLELEHGVVRAVLALEEPYRATVVAVYYEGLTPADLARREGVPAGTVRARLSRALEHLRGKLDREHGDRATWGLALVGLLRSREGALATSSGGAAGVAGPASLSAPAVAAAVVAAVGIVTVGAWWIVGPARTQAPAVAALEAAHAEPDLVNVPQSRRRVELEDDASVAALEAASPAVVASATELEELASLLKQVRAIEIELLGRRLQVDPALRSRYPWLEALPEAGLVRLLEDHAKDFPKDLGWIDEEAATYSFSARAHSPLRHPQIELTAGRLASGIYGENQGVVLDLGEGVFERLGAYWDPVLAGVDQELSRAIDALRAPVRPEELVDYQWLPRRASAFGLHDRADVRVGHTYLVRSVSEDGGDVLVALEVAAHGYGDCTIAWQVLERNPWTSPYPTGSEFDASAPGPGSIPELASSSIEALAAQLEALRARGEELLLESIPPDASATWSDRLAGEDAGLARIVDRQSPWKQLPRQREGGAYWSFVRRSHDYNHEPDLGLEGGIFQSGFVVRRFGMVVDLGERPMPGTLADLESLSSSPAVHLALTATIDRRAPDDEVEERVDELKRLREECRPWHSVKARAGHSYAVRSMLPEHDVLAVFEVVELDERGALIAWRILRTLPVEKPR